MATHSSVLGLENPRAGEAWWASVCGVAQSRTRLKRLSSKLDSVVEGSGDEFWVDLSRAFLRMGCNPALSVYLRSQRVLRIWLDGLLNSFEAGSCGRWVSRNLFKATNSGAPEASIFLYLFE